MGIGALHFDTMRYRRTKINDNTAKAFGILFGKSFSPFIQGFSPIRYGGVEVPQLRRRTIVIREQWTI